MGVAENLKAIRDQIPGHVTLVAVSKTKADEVIMEAYRAGHRDFGEDKVQDLSAKQARLPADIRWHMIGHLQSKKVKLIALSEPAKKQSKEKVPLDDSAANQVVDFINKHSN